MRRQHNGGATALQPLQRIPEQVTRLRIEAGSRLVEHQDSWAGNERTCNGESTLHATRERLHLVLRAIAELEEFKQFIGPGRNAGAIHAEEATEDEQVLAHGQLHVQRLLLMYNADLATNLGAVEIWILAKDLQRSRGTWRDARDHAHGRRLPSTVRPEEAEELAVANVEVDAGHG